MPAAEARPTVDLLLGHKERDRMKPRMILLTAAAAAALVGAAGHTARAAPTDALSSGSQDAIRIAQSNYKAPDRHRGETSARAKRLLHNPGLPPWFP